MKKLFTMGLLALSIGVFTSCEKEEDDIDGLLPSGLPSDVNNSDSHIRQANQADTYALDGLNHNLDIIATSEKEF